MRMEKKPTILRRLIKKAGRKIRKESGQPRGCKGGGWKGEREWK